MKSVITEEEDILYKLNSAASKRGKTICSLRACEVVDFSSQYGSNECISYSAQNLTGPPTIFPRTGDNAYSFQMRTYGEWWQILPSSRKNKVLLPAGVAVDSEDFIEFLVEVRVAPKLIRIYEILNPGAIVKFLCYCYEKSKWITLWKGEPLILPPDVSNCFSVDIKEIDFLTDFYRIEFYHKHSEYYSEIDGIILYGESAKSDFDSVILPSPFLPHYLNNKKLTPPLPSPPLSPPSSSSSSAPCEVPETSQTESGKSCFDGVPSEVIHLILSYLDLQSLCATARVSKFFHKLCYDPVLYKDLNLKLYWHLVDEKALQTLAPRLSSLKSLNMAWCGGEGRISSAYFIEFLESICQNITSLKLGNCQFINNNCLKAIASYCPFIKELELQSCRAKDLTPNGFKCIAGMSNLTYLNLYRTEIDRNSLILIIKSLKLEHLFLGGCSKLSDMSNEVAKTIGTHLKDIKTLDFWRIKDLTCVGTCALADNCCELVELDLGWCHRVDASCGCIKQLITHCPKLKKLFLTAIRSVSSYDINAIAAHCPDIEQLDILGTNEVSLDCVKNLLHCCKKLKLLDISYCKALTNNIHDLEANFPHVKIKCSAPTNFEF